MKLIIEDFNYNRPNESRLIGMVKQGVISWEKVAKIILKNLKDSEIERIVKAEGLWDDAGYIDDEGYFDLNESEEIEINLDDIDPFDLVMDAIVYNDRQVQVTDPKTGKTSPRVYHGLYDYDKVGVTKDDNISITYLTKTPLKRGIQFAKDYEIEYKVHHNTHPDEWVLELDPWTVNVEKLYPDRNKFVTGGMYKKGGKSVTERLSLTGSKWVDKLIKMGINKDDAIVYINLAMDADEDLEGDPYDSMSDEDWKEDVKTAINSLGDDEYSEYLSLDYYLES